MEMILCLHMNDMLMLFGLYYGLLFMLSGFALVVNRYSWSQVIGDVEDNHAVLLLGGGIALFIGLFTLISTSLDGLSFETVIYLLGWISVLKAVVIFLTPNWLVRLSKHMLGSAHLHTFALVSFLTGSLLLLAGFGVI